MPGAALRGPRPRATLEIDVSAQTPSQQGGIVVHTTLDLNIQQIAQQAVSNGVQDLFVHPCQQLGDAWPPDPKTGEILAWVGSADYGNDSIAGTVRPSSLASASLVVFQAVRI